jgi:hypothetical protein
MAFGYFIFHNETPEKLIEHQLKTQSLIMIFRIISAIWFVYTGLLIVVNSIGVYALFNEFFTTGNLHTKLPMLFIFVVALFYILFAFLNLTYFNAILFKKTLHHLSSLRVVSLLNLLMIGIYATFYIVLMSSEGTFHIQIPLMLIAFTLQLYIIRHQNSFLTKRSS